jgi:hypothetical protein
MIYRKIISCIFCVLQLPLLVYNIINDAPKVTVIVGTICFIVSAICTSLMSAIPTPKRITCREKLKREEPELIDDTFCGGCAGCPHIYNYLPPPIYCLGPHAENCTKCWDRRIDDD